MKSKSYKQNKNKYATSGVKLVPVGIHKFTLQGADRFKCIWS